MFYFTVIFIIVTKGKTILLFSLIKIPKINISYISRNYAFKKNNLERSTNGEKKLCNKQKIVVMLGNKEQ